MDFLLALDPKVTEVYRALRALKKSEWEREVIIVGQSKLCWKAEWKQLRKEVKKSKAA